MACERFAGQLRDVAAGCEPAPALAAHVERCAPCREALGAERRLIASLDADVVRAIGVEPSADFEARVRARVASRLEPTRWFGGWRFAAALASVAVVAVVVAVALFQREGVRGRPEAVGRTPSASDGAHARVARGNPPPAEAVGVSEPVHAVASAETAGAGAAPPVRRTAVPEPEVIVARDQQLVIAGLFEMLRRGRLGERAADQPSEAPQPPGPIVVGELTVAPIVVTPTETDKQQQTHEGGD